jgi:hypothetical protein
MQRMNERPMRHLGLSRRELFEKIERAVLTALPAEDWEFAEWRRARVNLTPESACLESWVKPRFPLRHGSRPCSRCFAFGPGRSLDRERRVAVGVRKISAVSLDLRNR